MATPFKAVIAAYNPKTRKTLYLYAIPKGPTYTYAQLKDVKFEWVNSPKAASRLDAHLFSCIDEEDSNLSFDPIKLNQQGELILDYLKSNIQQHLPKDFTCLRVHAFNNVSDAKIIQERFPVFKQVSPKQLKVNPLSKSSLPKSTISVLKKLVPLSPPAPKKITTTSPNKNDDIFPIFEVSPGIHPFSKKTHYIRHEPPEPDKPKTKTIHPVTPKQLDLD